MYLFDLFLRKAKSGNLAPPVGQQEKIFLHTFGLTMNIQKIAPKR